MDERGKTIADETFWIVLGITILEEDVMAAWKIVLSVIAEKYMADLVW